MIAALFALAAAMVIGGAAAVVQGFPYVRIESGLAMVIAGSVTASSGAVLFGLGVVASGLRRVEKAAGRVFAGAGVVPAHEPPATPPAPVSEGRPRLPPVIPTAAGAMEAPTIKPPAFVLPVEAEASRSEPEPELPIPGLTPAPPLPERSPEPQPAHVEAGPAPISEDDLFAEPEDRPNAGKPLSLRPGLDAVPASEPEAVPPRTVVGRYASGGNTYVMFEDGSIEAETPQGRFTFPSLEELKAFVDGGGEAGTRGAA